MKRGVFVRTIAEVLGLGCKNYSANSKNKVGFIVGGGSYRIPSERLLRSSL